MGGNALAEFGAKRFEKEEYLKLSAEVLDLLKDYSPTEITWYPAKQSFGDMDVVIPASKELTDKVFLRQLVESIKPKISAIHSHYVLNTNCLSLLYKDLQVDITCWPEEDVQSSLDYYAYNDLGNLLGKIFHKFGLKYGHRGLTLPLRDGTNMFAELEISKDQRQIYWFLGLNFDKRKEIQTLEDIFRFVVSSPMFCSDIYDYVALNHKNRVRDKKRSTYRGFLDWIYTTKVPGSTLSIKEYYSAENNGFKFDPDKYNYLEAIFKAFPERRIEYESLCNKQELSRLVKERYNGDLVKEITLLSGRDLGHFMKFVKESGGLTTTMILNLPERKIKECIVSLFSKYKMEKVHAT